MDEAELEDGDGDEDVAHNHPSVDGREVGSVGQSVARSRVQHHQNQHAHDAWKSERGNDILMVLRF